MTITLNPPESPPNSEDFSDFWHESSDDMADKEFEINEDLTIDVPDNKPIIIEPIEPQPQPEISETIETNDRNSNIGKSLLGITLAFVSGIIFTGNNWFS